MLHQVPLQLLERLVDRIHAAEQLQILLVDRAPLGQRLELEDLVPVLAAVEDDEQLLRELARLREREDLEHLVDRAEAAGKDHQRLGEVGEPELPHEEVVEVEDEILR